MTQQCSTNHGTCLRDVGIQKPRRFVGGIATIQTGRLEGSVLMHQNLQVKGHKYYLMTTPIILNVVIVSTKHLLQASTKHFSQVQCSLSAIFRAQTVFKFK